MKNTLSAILILFSLSSFSQLRSAGTGSGNIVYSTSPTLVTPTLGAATATSINGNTFTTGTYTLTGVAGKTLTFNKSITLEGTDATIMTFPTTSKTVAANDGSNLTISGQAIGDLMVASSTTAYGKLAAVATGSYLRSAGTTTAPVWSTLTIPNAATTGDLITATGTNALGVVAVNATANKVLMSGASAVPTWSTPTFPNSSATSRKIIVSDGTNWTASTELWPIATTSGNTLVSDGTNWVTSATRNNWTSLVVSGSNYTNATTGLTDITGLVSGTLAVATLYEFNATLYVNSSSAAGMQIALQQTGTGSGQIGVWSGDATNAAATGMSIGSNTLGTQGAACVLVAADGVITIRGFVKTGSTGTPTIKLQALKTTSGTATVYIGSVMRFRVAN